MPGRNYYLLTSLPSIGRPGDEAPLTPREFLERVADAPKVRTEAEALFLGDDLLQRQAVLAGEIDQATPAVLSDAQIRDEAPLPAMLVPSDDSDDVPAADAATDTVWAAYFRQLADLGRRSPFLHAWVRHEVGLRNALASARAKALELDPQTCLVAPELGDPADDFARELADWSAAATPLAGLQALDQGRWRWLLAHDAWFSFADDELAAYAAKLMLLARWKRIADAQRAPAAEAAAGPANL